MLWVVGVLSYVHFNEITHFHFSFHLYIKPVSFDSWGSINMVSEQPFGPWGIKSGDEKQVEDRVAETKIDGIQLEIHEDMKTLKSEINKVMSGMMEKMDLIMKKWDRKDIGIAINLTGNNADP